MTLGFVGLGEMGIGMARNLLKAGHEVSVYNRTRRKAEALVPDSAQVAVSIKNVSAAGVIHTMVSDDPALEAVVFDADGILASLPKGGLHVSQSTISRALAERLAVAHQEAGQQFISAPVFGRPDASAAAQLVIVAAGPRNAIERALPALEAMARRVEIVGDQPWQANVFKLAGNFTIASALETLAEAFALLRKSGIDPAKFLDVVGGGVFRSPVYENYGKIILDERFTPPGFPLSLGLKDIRFVLSAAETAQTPMPVASLIRDQMIGSIAQGWGSLDWSAFSRLAAQNAGLMTKE